jgi:hypothetical protein
VPAPRINPVFRASIKRGDVCFQGIDGKRWFALKQHLEGKEVEITLQKRRKKRSLNQNSYYWGCVLLHVMEAGGFLTDEEAHDAMRMHFLVKRDGPLPTVRSTTELTTAEFEEYLEKIRILAAQMWGEYIPLPNEVEIKA